MFYVKTDVAEGVTIRAEITDENVFNQCPRCGAEVPVDLADMVTDGGLDLYGTAIYCDKCADALRAEQEEEGRYKKCKAAHGGGKYFDALTAAMEAAMKVWDADAVTPKIPPEAFPSEEN